MSIVLTNWLPAIVAILVGGYLTRLYFPRIQNQILMNTQNSERRLEVALGIAKELRSYFRSWGRVIQISTLEVERHNNAEELTAEELERKRLFLNERNSRRDALYDTLMSSELFFSDETIELLRSFRGWDRKLETARMGEFPQQAEWDSWEEAILARIKSEVNGGQKLGS